MPAAIGTVDSLVIDKFLHPGEIPSCGICACILNQLVRTVAGLAAFAVHQGVGKAADMTRCNPGLGVH